MTKPHDRAAASGRKRKSDADFYRMTVLFFALSGMTLLLLNASANIAKRHASGANTAYNLHLLFRFPVTAVIVGLIAAVSLVWFTVCRVKKKDENMAYFSSTNALLLSAYLVFFALFFGTRVVANRSECLFFLCVTAALAALYYIYKIFRTDFFVFSVENAVLILLLYRYWHIYGTRGIVGKTLVVLVALYWGIYFRIWLSKHAASRFVGGNERRGFLMWPYFVSLGIFALFMFIKLPNPTAAPPVPVRTMLTVMLIQYALFGIRYTVRLIRE